MNDEREKAQEAEVPAEADETTAKEEPKRREITPEKLKAILDDHEKWVDSGGKEGTHADLSHVNLREANLQEANLQKANLQEANLQWANLVNANLQSAILQEANLQEAFIWEANLQEAKLVNANLQEAKLERANLRGAKLWGANLYRANLQGASLFEADLRGANLQGARLQGAKFQWANLLRTELRETNLQDADLTGATGLLGEQLAGANVSGAKLPDDIKEFKGLETVEEASRNARKIFLAMLLGCAYSLLTIFSTKDAALLTNSATSPLPIIQTGVPIAGFFIVAPIILFAIYLYFHIYLQRLWEGLADLPAIFPDGRPLDKRAYPWLLNGLVRAHFKLLEDRPPHSGLQTLVSVFLAWLAVPATLFFFWGRYIPKHDWSWTGSKTHIALLVVTVGFGLLSYLYTRTTLQGREMRRWNYRALSGVVALGFGVAFYFLSIGAIEGIPSKDQPQDLTLKISDIRTWVPRAFEFFGWRTFADLEEVDVSTKPQNWTGQEEKEKEEIALVKGARLKDADLRYADAFRAFLVKADLRGANLQGAYLEDADLQRANLEDANLQGADLGYADMRKANLRNAVLQGADLQYADLLGAKNLTASQLDKVNNRVLAYYDSDFLSELGLPPDHNRSVKEGDLSNAELGGANLQGANLRAADLTRASLWNADLQGAILVKANLQDVDLEDANLQGADLQGAKNLKPDQVKAAVNWVLASYDDDFLSKLGLPPDHNERLKNKDLSQAHLQGANLWKADLQRWNLQGANLQKADLWRANLQGANFQGANLEEAFLQEADLQGADFIRVKGLEAVELKTATNWVLAFYDDEFLKRNKEELRLKPGHNKRLKERDLSQAHLQGANLWKADLQRWNLQGANLQGANLSESILDEADLRGANLQDAKLQGAYLWGANLIGANLQEANLGEADLRRANLQGANLKGANLRGADLYGAQLQKANLSEANLHEASLLEADLQEANLGETDLQGADLQGAKNLIASQIKAARNWKLAFYDREFLKELDLPPDHNERLQEKLAELEKQEEAAAGKK